MLTFFFFLVALLLLPGIPAQATTKTQDAAMAACLEYAHAKDVVQYCVAKRGTKRQQACVAVAQGREALRACVKGGTE